MDKSDAELDPFEEILEILPPPLARLLVFLAKRLNPSGLQVINIKKQLKEEPKTDLYSLYKTENILKALTVGLKPYALALAISAVVWLFTTLVSPMFFIYLYFHFEFFGIFSSWPLLLWGGLLSSVVWYFYGRDINCQGRPFLIKAANGLLLATIEELGFRFFFICLAMVVVASVNLFLEHAGIYMGVLMIILGLVLLALSVLHLTRLLKQFKRINQIMKRYNAVHVAVGSGLLVIAGMAVLFLGLLWSAMFSIVWDWIIFPLTNFFTAYQYDKLFMGAFGMNTNSYEGAWVGARRRRTIWQQNAQDNRMFMVGILLVNLFYRDGKKYQGVLGWIDSWYVGLALTNIMLNHGLFTALVVHLIYEAQFFAMGYLITKFFKKRRPSLDDL